MTDHVNEHQQSNGSVLVAASLAAGVIGGAVALLNEARKHAAHQPTPAEVVHEEAKQSASQLRESASRVLDVSKEQAPIVSKSIKEQASTQLGRVSDQTESAREHLHDALESRGVDVSAGVEQARDAVKRASDAAADAGGQAKKKAKKAKEQMSKVDVDGFSQAGRELTNRLRDKLPETGKNVSDQVAPKLADFKEQAGSTLAGVIEASRTRAPELAPRLKDFGKHASDVAASAAESGREHAPEWKTLFEEHLVPRIQEARERAATLASDAQAGDGVVPDLKHSADDLAKRFTESLGTAERSIADLKGNAAHAVDSVGTQARVVGKNASDGGKNAGAAIVWTGVAAGVVYVGLLKPEQREWVKQKANAAYCSAKDVYADVRGRDGDFESKNENGTGTPS
ncbi:MAG: hypothetical protein ACR2OU_08435 [Thermomicrobiales bacterium]